MFVLLLSVVVLCASARANSPIPSGYYDIDKLGVPKFVNTNYIDVSKISQISKFRSSAGHSYVDDVETCRSMKHYFIAPDATTVIVSPVAGTVTRLEDDFAGKQVHITSDLYPGFIFIIFHINLDKPLALGDHFTEGQRLGRHVGTQTFSDIAVAVNTPTKYRLISYFETLTDSAFAVFQARGLTSRDQLIVPKAVRDADPYFCGGESFVNLKVDPASEYVDLSGVQHIQVLTIPYVMVVGDTPYPLTFTASSSLPVQYTTSSAGVCTVTENKLSLVGAGDCIVYVDQPGDAQYLPAGQLRYAIKVYATPPGPRLGMVSSSAQTASTSFLRVINAGAAANTVNVALRDGTTGQKLGEWDSPSIPAGAAAQYSIAALESDIEKAAGQTLTKPPYYSVEIQTRMEGYVQHVAMAPGPGTFTNLSTCDTGAATSPNLLPYVHSSLLEKAGYPSAIVVTNTGPTPASVQLAIFNAATGDKLGAYTTPAVPSNGQITVAIPVMESEAQISTDLGVNHYIVKAEGAFSGYLQHLVTNTQTGVTVDMTTVCPMRASPSTTVATRIGSVYSTAQTETRSFIRVFNAGTQAGTVKLTLADAATGISLGQWTSPSIAADVSRQFGMEEIEGGAGVTGLKPVNYVISIQSQFETGYIQHVVFQPSLGTLTNRTTCDAGVTSLANQLINVHSKLLTANYPSTVVVTNTDTVGSGVVLRTGDAATGHAYGNYVISYMPATSEALVSASVIENRITPLLTANIGHYNLKATGYFAAFLQHLVTNKMSGVVSDMTAMCRIN